MIVGEPIRSGLGWIKLHRNFRYAQTHLLLLTFITGFPAATSALACDRRSLLHLARFRTSLHEIDNRGWPGYCGGPKVARRDGVMWPIRCQYVPIPQIHRDQPAFSRYKDPRNVNECSWSPCAVNRRNRPAGGRCGEPVC